MKSLQDIRELCKQHRRTSYFDDGQFIGVYNHRNVVLWYKWTQAGYSQVGETRTPEGAQLRKLDD